MIIWASEFFPDPYGQPIRIRFWFFRALLVDYGICVLVVMLKFFCRVFCAVQVELFQLWNWNVGEPACLVAESL